MIISMCKQGMGENERHKLMKAIQIKCTHLCAALMMLNSLLNVCKKRAIETNTIGTPGGGEGGLSTYFSVGG